MGEKRNQELSYNCLRRLTHLSFYRAHCWCCATRLGRLFRSFQEKIKQGATYFAHLFLHAFLAPPFALLLLNLSLRPLPCANVRSQNDSIILTRLFFLSGSEARGSVGDLDWLTTALPPVGRATATHATTLCIHHLPAAHYYYYTP